MTCDWTVTWGSDIGYYHKCNEKNLEIYVIWCSHLNEAGLWPGFAIIIEDIVCILILVREKNTSICTPSDCIENTGWKKVEW